MKKRTEKKQRSCAFAKLAAADYAAAFAKWLGIALIVGVLGGAVGTLFHLAIEKALDLRSANPWLLWCLPAAGLLITLIYRTLHLDNVGTDTVLDAVHDGKNVPLAMIPAIFVCSALTHLCGGSAGREGAALQMGGNIGRHVAAWLRLDDKDRRLATLCGMSALFSALFDTPLAAAVFALEVASVGAFYYVGFLPCIVASLLASGVSALAGVPFTRFALAMPAVDAVLVLKVVALAVPAALLSILLCEAMHRTARLAKRLKNPYLRAAMGGAAIVALTLLLGTTDYNGVGMDVIRRAIEAGECRSLDFLWKLVFTAVTIGCGYKGGEVVPTFFVGATFGCAVSPLLGLPAGFAAAVCLIGVFCGAVNCPLASILLSVEMFGADGLLCFALTCGITYMLSGYHGLYNSQKILYSKRKAEFINIRANERDRK